MAKNNVFVQGNYVDVHDNKIVNIALGDNGVNALTMQNHNHYPEQHSQAEETQADDREEETPFIEVDNREQPLMTFTSRYDGMKLITVYNRLKDDYLDCSEEDWLYIWGVFIHPVRRTPVGRPASPAVWSAMRGKKAALMEMIRMVMAQDCGEILKKTSQWFVYSDGSLPKPENLKSSRLQGKTKETFRRLVTVY